MKYKRTKSSRLVFVPAALVFATATVPTVAYRVVTARSAAAAADADRRLPTFMAPDAFACDAGSQGVSPKLAVVPPVQAETVATVAE